MRRTVVEWVVTLAVAALFVLVFEAEIAQPFRVPTSSMEPTLHCARPGMGCTGSLNDRVLVAKIIYRFRAPKRFEIAVFHAPARARTACSEGGTYLKRVIGLPGDKVSERNGKFYVDGEKLREPYLSFYERDDVTSSWPRLGKDQYFVMGDNRIGSCDSRTWGSVPRGSFIGPVVATYWPPTRWTVR
ncbi:MAG: signal peptidase [Gaiellaceae bacterium]|jgi:signal peptidase I|nr:signal peptidase [Gaiellaceae bacterium]